MEEKSSKNVIRFFTPADYEEERSFLRGMNLSGWKLVNIKAGVIYQFESCEPEEYAYVIDIHDVTAETKERYLHRFEGRGWEHIIDHGGCSYFRRSAEAAESDESIFCSVDTRVELLENYIKTAFLPLFIMLLCFAGLHMTSSAAGKWSLIFLPIIVLYAAAFAVFYRKYRIFLIKNELY